MRMSALAVWCLLATSAAAAPADQELAGPSRPASDGQPTMRPAIAEHPADAAPAILFAPGSARLTPSATRLLDGLSRMLAEDRVRLESHAGRDRDLAARRTGAVVAYLEQNCGVLAERVRVVTAAGADDRRVWVQDLGQ